MTQKSATALGIAALAALGLAACGETVAYSQADCIRWNTPEFFSAARAADVTRCLGEGANVHARDTDNMTPLHYAAVLPDVHPDVVRALLTAGANPNAVGGAERDLIGDFMGYRPLHFVAATSDQGDHRRKRQIAEMLIIAGADVQARAVGSETDLATPLYYAARASSSQLVRLLLAAGADPNAVARDGSTPLHAAAFAGTRCPDFVEGAVYSGLPEPCAGDGPADIRAITDVIEQLLDAGTDPTRRRNDGRTALDLAAANDLRNSRAHERLRAHASPGR